MVAVVFGFDEAQALQGRLLSAKQDFTDEFDRVLIPSHSWCRVIGIDAWEDEDGDRTACIAIQYNEAGAVPKVVLVNKSTFEESFETVTHEPHTNLKINP